MSSSLPASAAVGIIWHSLALANGGDSSMGLSGRVRSGVLDAMGPHLANKPWPCGNPLEFDRL